MTMPRVRTCDPVARGRATACADGPAMDRTADQAGGWRAKAPPRSVRRDAVPYLARAPHAGSRMAAAAGFVSLVGAGPATRTCSRSRPRGGCAPPTRSSTTTSSVTACWRSSRAAPSATTPGKERANHTLRAGRDQRPARRSRARAACGRAPEGRRPVRVRPRRRGSAGARRGRRRLRGRPRHHRGLASPPPRAFRSRTASTRDAVTFVAGHLRDGTMNLDWPALARPGQTLVVYMGLAGLPELCRQLGRARPRAVRRPRR